MTQILTRFVGNRVDTLKAIARCRMRDSTASEGMRGRMLDVRECGRESSYFSYGGWHSEGTARINGVNYWCKASFAPTTLYPRQTLDANIKNRYLELTEDIKIGTKPATEVIQRIAEIDAKKPVSKRRILIPTDQSFYYTRETRDLGSQDVPVFLAEDEDLANDYGDMLSGFKLAFVAFKQLSGKENIASGFEFDVLGDHTEGSCFQGDKKGFGWVAGSSFGVHRQVRSSIKKKDSDERILSPSLRDIQKYTLPFVSPNHKDIFLDGLEKIFQSNKGKLR